VILVDTSVWVDHLAAEDPAMAELLRAGKVLMHPYVLGEIALGNLRQRELILASLSDLPQADVAEADEVLRLVQRGRLWGSGIGYVDAHLLAALRLTGTVSLWTRDRKLASVAQSVGVRLGSQPH